MKKILYQHIESVGRIHKQDIYYSHDYIFTYNREKNSLKAEEKNDKFAHFYGENIEGISLIVGENGSGKTIIMELLALPDEKYTKRFAAPYFKNMSWFAVYKIGDNQFEVEGCGDFFDEKDGNIRQCKYGYFDEAGQFCEKKLGNNVESGGKDVLVYRPVHMAIKSSYSHVKKEVGYKKIFVDASVEDLCNFVLSGYNTYSGGHRMEPHEILVIQEEPPIDVTIESQYTNKQKFLLGLWLNSMDRISEYCNEKKNIKDLRTMWEIENRGEEEEAKYYLSDNDMDEFISSIGIDYGIESKHIPKIYYQQYMKRIDNCKYKKMYNAYNKKTNHIYIKFYEVEKRGEYDIKRESLIKEVIEYYSRRQNLFQNIPDKYFIAKNCIRMVINTDNKPYFNILQYTPTYSFDSYLYNDNDLSTPILRSEFSSMSTGEKNFIEMFTGLLTNISGLKNDSIGIICLDEPDNFLHPEWSRIFLSSFVQCLKEYTGKFQIIITSHSPLMTSDILKRDVWCIDGKGRIEQSKSGWMNNIHKVYQDAFYLKSTFGELGQKRFKEKIIDRLNQGDLDSDVYNNMLDLIDEVCDPVLSKTIAIQAERKRGEQ